MAIPFHIDSRSRDREHFSNPASFEITENQVLSWTSDRRAITAARPHNERVGVDTFSMRMHTLIIPYDRDIVNNNPVLMVEFRSLNHKDRNLVNAANGANPEATFVAVFDKLRDMTDSIRIDSSNNTIDFVYNLTTFAATVPTGNYTPEGLAAQLQTAMNEAASTTTIVVDYGTTLALHFSIRETAAIGAFNLLWNSGANSAVSIGDTLGFDITADDAGASPITYSADNVVLGWGDGGNSTRWAQYTAADMVQVMRFDTKRQPVVFRITTPSGAAVVYTDSTYPAAYDPFAQVSALFTATPFIQDGNFDNHYINIHTQRF